MKCWRVVPVLLVGLMLASGGQAAQADMIGVNFDGGSPAKQMTAADQPGVAPGANWNNISGSSGTAVALHDSSANVTTSALTFNSTGSFTTTGPSTPNAATNKLYGAAIYGDTAVREVTIGVTGVPYSNYDLYVYASQDTTATNTLSITNGTTTYYYRGNGQGNSTATSLLQTTSTSPGTPTVGPAQYQVFSGLTGSSFNLTTAGSTNNVLSNNVFGFQIVNNAAPVPEPSTWAMMFLGLGGIAVSGWRKKRKDAAV